MRLILRYLKPFTHIVLCCLLLLFFQAVCDLSLPDLMSGIVNNGIQTNGVQKGAPEALSKEAMVFVTAFMPGPGKAEFENAYDLIDAGSAESKQYADTYPLTVGTDFFALRNRGVDEHIDTLYDRSVYTLVVMFRQLSQQFSAGGSRLYSEEEGFGNVSAEQLYAVLPALSMLPEGALKGFMETAAEADPMITGQIAPTFTGLFYRELGADLAQVQRAYIINTGLKMLGLTLLVTLTAILVGFLASRLAASISRKLRRDIFEKVMHFSNAEIDSFSTASLITRTTNDVSHVQMLIMVGIRMMCYAPIMGIGGVVMAIRKSASLSWIIALAVLVVLGIILIVFAMAMPKFTLQQKLIDKLNLVSRENLTGLMVIRAFGNEDHEQRRFDGVNRELTSVNRFIQRTIAVMFPTMSLIMNLLTLTIIWVGSNAIAASTMNIGNMIAFIQYSMQILMSFLMIAIMFVMIPRATVSAKRILEVLDTPFAIKDSAQPKSLAAVRGIVEFNDVSFRYNNAEMEVLKNISFTAEPGKTTALIGATGSGKSTIVNLIPRFYDVSGGSITIDGTDIRDISQRELREQIGYVSQKGILFSGDIASNIRYGRGEATEPDIEEALRTAQAEDFVAEREGGLNAPISQGGANVSGGQRQRLSIARALVKKPPVYIFDDTFSALDFKTDAALRSALSEYTGDSTMIIVAQRVGTIMNADQIIVLDRGQIVGRGRHRDLLKTCDAYREIAESQLSAEELA